MEKVIDLTKDDNVRSLTGKQTILKGHNLWTKGEVRFGTFRPERIEANVTDFDGQKYDIVFVSSEDGLTWKCTCTDDTTVFCHHLVTAALDAQREGRGDIYKAAGIILKDRRMLTERSVGKPAYISPGGRIEKGETPARALIRELKEEFQIDVGEDDLEPFGAFSAEAANHPGQQVHMQTFIVKKWRGEIQPNNEVEDILWVSSQLPKGAEIGSIFAHEVVPRLKAQDLID